MTKRIGMLLCFLSLCLLVGCTSPTKREGEMYVYYVNAEGNTLQQEIYPKMDIDKALGKIKEHSLLQPKVQLEHYELDNTQLKLYFSDAYYELEKSQEVLFRAAIVQTLVQLEEVEFVSFFIDKEPLQDENGNIMGFMRAEDFVQNTGASIDSYQTTELMLYFADKEGKALKEVTKSKVRYNANTSIERLVVEQLMKGTSASGKQATIPKTTKLLGLSVKEGICYVNFDSKFALDSYDLDPNVTIYSIVNSIIANGNVTKVQILIEGASDVVYKNSVDLSRPLEWEEKLIKE